MYLCKSVLGTLKMVVCKRVLVGDPLSVLLQVLASLGVARRSAGCVPPVSGSFRIPLRKRAIPQDGHGLR